MPRTPQDSEMPKAFISYAWESEEHKSWIRKLAERLVLNGVETRLDQWHIAPGQSLTQFMEKEVQECDYILVICTKTYCQKSIARQGGVGYEQQIISAHIVNGMPRERFIPIIRDGDFIPGPNCAIPPHFSGIYSIDMRTDATFDAKLEELLRAIYKQPVHVPPKLGAPPSFQSPLVSDANPEIEEFENLRLATIDLDGWHLLSGVAQHHRTPDTFWIPPEKERRTLNEGDIVKLVFEISLAEKSDAENVSCERMWVTVKGKSGPYYYRTLDNQPACFDETNVLAFGDKVIFLPEHIINIW